MASTLDMNIAASVRALAAGRGMTHLGVARTVGISQTTFERRMARGGWSVDEAARIADLFEVTINDLATGLSGTVATTEEETS